MAHVVKRTYGKHGFDYLHAWCDQWGTSCMGSVSLAMKFENHAEAVAAASRAKAVCRGVDGPATGIEFQAVEVAE